MVTWLMRRAIGAFERKWNYDARYLHDIVDASPRAARLFWGVASLGQYRRDVPFEAWSAAGITAARLEDCVPCTQLAVTMAERAGVSPAVLRAVLADDPERMPADVALVWRFTRASLARDLAADGYRDAVVKRWGLRALVSLAFQMAAARVYPTVKYALGHGNACTRVIVGGEQLAMDRERAVGHGPRPTPASVGG